MANDENGNTQYWGCPLIWGQAGCGNDYPVDQNNKVTVCHMPPGNPNNLQTISVSVNAVQSHLTHGDWIGDCNACNPAAYTNRYVEYRLGADNLLWRRVLDANLAVINQTVIAGSVTDIQASFNAGQTASFRSATLIIRVWGRGAVRPFWAARSPIITGPLDDFNGPTGQQLSGYGRNFVYDQRMKQEQSPPYFPSLNTFIAFTNDITDKMVWQEGE